MRSYSETLKYIFNLRGGEIDLRLQRVHQALALFDHPERCYPAFHIAGTNGKGSTAAMLHRILFLHGYRTGLYTSPHVVSFTERIRVGDKEISPQEVVELAESIQRRLEEESIGLTFFEFVTVMAFLYFARREIGVAVVEVGLGGRLDATNLVSPCVSIITTISKDHEAYLGSDILAIAREKGGIIKEGIPVVGGALLPEVEGLLGEIANAKGSAHFFLGRDFSFELKEGGHFNYQGLEWHLSDLSLALRGIYQRANAALVLGALEVARSSFPVSEIAIRAGLSSVFWPGRFEVIAVQPTVILDGAHNGEGVRALVNEIRHFQGEKKVRLLFAAMGDKDWSLMLGELSEVASEVVLTRVPMERSANPQRLAEAVPEGIRIRTIESPVEAADYLISSARLDDTILVAGSLYLLGEVRARLVAAAERQGAAERKSLEA